MIFQIKILSSSQPGGKFKTMKKSANKIYLAAKCFGYLTILLEKTKSALKMLSNQNCIILLVKNKVRFAQHKLSFKELEHYIFRVNNFECQL